MGLLGCDSDSLSKPAGRGPDEKRDRTEESRGGVGERKPSPSYTTPALRHSASAKTLMWSRWKWSLDFSLLPGFLPAFRDFCAALTVLQRNYWLKFGKWFAETRIKDCLRNKTYVKLQGKRWIHFSQAWTYCFRWMNDKATCKTSLYSQQVLDL